MAQVDHGLAEVLRTVGHLDAHRPDAHAALSAKRQRQAPAPEVAQTYSESKGIAELPDIAGKCAFALGTANPPGAPGRMGASLVPKVAGVV